MAKHPTSLDRIFHALSDPTRRAVLTHLSDTDATTGELAKPFDMALPSFLQHLAVLEECGLVQSRKVGRVRSYELNPENLTFAARWLDQQRRLWETRFDQFDRFAPSHKEKT